MSTDCFKVCHSSKSSPITGKIGYVGGCQRRCVFSYINFRQDYEV